MNSSRYGNVPPEQQREKFTVDVWDNRSLTPRTVVRTLLRFIGRTE